MTAGYRADHGAGSGTMHVVGTALGGWVGLFGWGRRSALGNRRVGTDIRVRTTG
jgi:hypothetical protein